MTVPGIVRRGLRVVARWWWAEVRPSTGADLRSTAVALDPEVTGRPPRPEERLRPATTPTGPWAQVDPHVAGPWPSRGRLAGALVWAGLVGLYARRLAGTPREG